MERSEKFQRTFEKFEKALKKFRQIVTDDELLKGLDDDLKVELATKRFEYTFESCWKVLQAFLRVEGVNAATPLKCFKEAFKAGNINEEYEEILVTMIEKRNQIVHVYDFDQAKLIYEFINSSEVIDVFENIYRNLKY